MPKVYNKHHGDAPKTAVYIGRGSPFGNPYLIGESLFGTLSREEAVDLYEDDVKDDEEFQQFIKKHLRGQDLLCFCKPKRCHGDILLKIANEE